MTRAARLPEPISDLPGAAQLSGVRPIAGVLPEPTRTTALADRPKKLPK
jgi:hypothetical protein